MNPNFNSAGLPTLLDVISSSLSPQAGKFLVQAFESKQISTGEIAELLVPSARKGLAFTNALRTLTQVFREYGVNVTYSVIERTPKSAPQQQAKKEPPKTEVIPKPVAIVEPWQKPINSGLADKLIPLELEDKLKLGEPVKTEADILHEQEWTKVDEKVTTSFLADLSATQSEFEGEYHADALLAMYMRDINTFSLLTREQVQEIGALSFDKKDKSARNKLIVHNLRLVIGMAKKYQNRGVSLADLIQEGNLGLVKAAERFNPHLGNTFGTYAMWWIRQSITRAIDNMGSIVRKPVHYLEKRREPYRKIKRLAEQLGRMPTDEEIKEKTGYPGGLEGAILLMRNMDSVSFDDPLNEGSPEALTLGDVMSDTNNRPADLVLDVEIKFEVVAKDIRELTKTIMSIDTNDRNKMIFFRRYGLNGHSPATLEGVARHYNITRERVRQLAVKIWEILENNKVEYDEVSLEDMLRQVHELEMIVGRKADLIPRQSDQSLLLVDGDFVEITPGEEVDEIEEPIQITEKVPRTDVVPSLSKDPVSVMVVNTVGKKTSVPPLMLLGPERERRISRARRIAMYLLHEDFKKPFVAIGELFGKADQQVPRLAYKLIGYDVAHDQEVASLVEKIRAEYTIQPETQI